MAPRKTPGSPKPDKLMRDALALELHQQVRDGADGNKRGKLVKKLRLVARALVDAAISGDVAAIKEINDRMDGKVSPIVMTNSDGSGMSLEELIHLSYAAGKKAKPPEDEPGPAP